MIKYKVVRPTLSENKFSSCVAMGQAQTIYTLNKWTHTKKVWLKRGYLLTVFGKIEDAESFQENHPGSVLFECEVKGEHKPYKKLPPIRLSVIVSGAFYPSYLDSKIPFPDGTEMWEYVKLTRRIR